MKLVKGSRWALELHWAPGTEIPYTKLASRQAAACFHGFAYSVKLARGSFRSLPSDNAIRIIPSKDEIVINF